MHYADFAEDEVSFHSIYHCIHAQCAKAGVQSAALLAAIRDYEANKWKHIGAKLNKPAKVRALTTLQSTSIDHVQACEQYAKEHFSGRV